MVNEMTRLSKLTSIFFCLTFLLSACGGSPAAPAPVDQGPTVDPNLVFTSGAQTVVAQITLDAANRPVPTAALPPTQTMDPAGALPTLGTVNTLAPAAPVGTPVTVSPDRLKWVKNTPPDESKVPAGKKFKITWTVQNAGTTTWDNTYVFRFYAGQQFATQDAYTVTKDVAPGKNYDLTVDAVAPTTPGTYDSIWVLQRPDGKNMLEAFYITLTVQ
jgi:hypothetical protein